MRISELSRRSGVSVATIKFYLRDGLLHDGRRTSVTQASYDDTHVERLRMVRALVGVGGMSLARVKEVLAVIEAPPDSMHDLLGLTSQDEPLVADEKQAHETDPRVAALLESFGWDVRDSSPGSRAALAEALDGLADAGFDVPDATMHTYGEHVRAIARTEVAGIPTGSRQAAVRYVVLGTPLVEPLLLALRRIAQQLESARQYGDPGRHERDSCVTPAQPPE